MKLTNKKNYCSIFEQWLKFDEYDRDSNTITATEINRPLRSNILEKRYWDKLEIDIDELIASRYGTAIHDSFEKIKLKDCLQEQRLRTIVNNKVITGKFDILQKEKDETYTLVDIKSTSCWTWIYGSKKDDYVDQLSIYRFLGEKSGFKINAKAKILYVFTDWKKADSLTNKDYPQKRLLESEITLKEVDDVENEIKHYISLLNAYEKTADNDLPYCTADELWKTDDTFAVIKDGLKKAKRVLNSEQDAKEYINGDTTLKIEKRLGKVKRCAYCNVKSVCNQYKQLDIAGVIY